MIPLGLEKVVIRSVDIIGEKGSPERPAHIAELEARAGFCQGTRRSPELLWPSGKYEIEVICKPGYVVGKCEFSREKPGSNFFGKMNPLLIANLEPWGTRSFSNSRLKKPLPITNRVSLAGSSSSTART